MKKYLLFAASAALLASCSSDELVGAGTSQGSDAIGFGSSAKTTTRADFVHGQAAEKLNNNFIVYGFKTMGGAEVGAGDGDQNVFDLYNVNYTEGSANTTESNTAGWEYVGYSSQKDKAQTIKYWDLSANSYVFSAVSGTGITAEKILTGASVYEKGWTVNVPAGGSLADLYASDRKPVAKADFRQQVDLTFRALGTKIRFAMYETIPGYSVHVDKMYYKEDGASSWSNTLTNFAINGKFKNVKSDAATPLTVTYYDDTDASVENRPKVTFTDTDVKNDVYGVFGANIQASDELGTTSVEATYDQSDKSYTMILPYEATDNVLYLYVDYTLTSTDGNGETIKVKHASAKVPAEYNQWKPNFAYTYMFKISDNTNGTTGNPGTDPDDPTIDPSDEAGLYPITFDAVVITDETDTRETITTVAEPSITTYAKGTIVTENDEYIDASDVYVTVMAGKPTALQALGGGVSAVYEVHNTGTIETKVTEEIVANWVNNFCTLTPVNVDLTVTDVPLSDGTNMTFTAGNVAKFTAKAGKVYAFVFVDANGAHYKVIHVKGTEAAVANTLTTSAASITATDGTATLTLQQDGIAIYGAVPCFEVTSANGNNALKIATGANPGEYTVSVDQDAIKAGKANDTYTVKFGDKSVTITVNIAYALISATLNIEAGASANTQLRIGGVANVEGVVTEVPEGITITPATTYYKVAVASTVATGAYTAKIAGVTLTINVTNYVFNPATVTMTKPYNDNAYANINLWDGSAAPAVEASAISGITTGLAIANVNASADGTYTLTGSAGGVYTLTYNKTAAKCVVTVNEYSIATPASIKKSTGVATIDVKCNGTAINASTASLVETAKPAGAVYTVTTNGKSIKFSNASKAGDYNFDYKVGTTIVAQVTVTVTD